MSFTSSAWMIGLRGGMNIVRFVIDRLFRIWRRNSITVRTILGRCLLLWWYKFRRFEQSESAGSTIQAAGWTVLHRIFDYARRSFLGVVNNLIPISYVDRIWRIREKEGVLTGGRHWNGRPHVACPRVEGGAPARASPAQVLPQVYQGRKVRCGWTWKIENMEYI